jgi:hypothetical protein
LEIAPRLTEKSASLEAAREEETEKDFLHVHTASLPTVSERR